MTNYMAKIIVTYGWNNKAIEGSLDEIVFLGRERSAASGLRGMREFIAYKTTSFMDRYPKMAQTMSRGKTSKIEASSPSVTFGASIIRRDR